MKIFKPITRLMNSMKFGAKFSLIAGLLAIPIIALLFLLLTDTNTNLDASKKRQVGAKYSEVLKDLLMDVQKHRVLAISYLEGDTSSKGKVEEQQAVIEEDFQDLKEIEMNSDGVIKGGEDWETLSNNWNEIISSLASSTIDQTIESHNQYIDLLVQYIVNSAEDTGLLLADSREGLNLAQINIITLPKLTESLGQIRVHGTAALSDEDNEMTLVSLKSLFQESLQSLQHQISMVSMDRGLEKVFKPLNERIINDSNTLMDTLDQEILETNNSSMSPDEFYNIATEAIDRGLEVDDESMNQIVSRVNDSVNSAEIKRNMMILLISVVVLLVIYAFLGFYFSIRNNIIKLKDVAEGVAKGDLTQSVSLHTKDEMKDIEVAFNDMVGSLKHLVNQINNSSDQVAAASEELTASSTQTTKATEHVANTIQQVSSGAESQLTGISESTRALEEISAGVQRIAENSSNVSNLTSETTGFADEGAKSIELNVSQMNSIHSSVLQSSKIIRELFERSNEIGQILEVIKGITDQTNLLALNASIEAARAGEHGKGFAVVAEEVRTLAEQTQKSSIQIADLISGMQSDTEKSVGMMTEVSTNVESGLEISKQAEQKFNQILQGMKEIAPQIEDVSATAQQMSAGTQEVLAGVIEISTISKENASSSDEVVASTQEQLASMEEITSSANSLTQMAEDLQELVKTFKA